MVLESSRWFLTYKHTELPPHFIISVFSDFFLKKRQGARYRHGLEYLSLAFLLLNQALMAPM